MIDIENLATTLGGQPKTDGGWMACCPAHDDRHPSLSIDLGANGTPVLKCFSGCSQDAVIDALKVLGLWHDHPSRNLTSEEMEEIRQRTEQRHERDQRKHIEAAGKAQAVWSAATPARHDHSYLARKQVVPTDTLREIDLDALEELINYHPQSGGEQFAAGRILIVPVKIGENISTLEMIDSTGRKSALAGGRKSGGYWATERLPDGDEGLQLLIGEGVATVLSAKAATGLSGVASLASSNLLSVARQMRDRYPKAEIIVLADLQKQTAESDLHAIKAAGDIGGKLAVPDFGPDQLEGMTDFNDLQILKGIDEVRRQIEKTASVADVASVAVAEWPEPFSLVASYEANPYPIEDLPGTIGDAVREVIGFVQCPVPLAACSALSAVSVVVQGLVDIRRAERLQGPTSLYFLAIADSGERKSTVDGFFTRPIQIWETEQAEGTKSDLKRYATEVQAWDSKKAGVLAAIKENVRKGKDTAALEKNLFDLESNEPIQPKVPRILFGDATPEALSYKLANGWPVGGVLSSEAGIILGGHSMGKDSAMRNMALLNSLWGAERVVIDRKASPSFVVKDARLTMGLAVQGDTVKAFLESSKGLARGIGWLARFLIAWPETTQGGRLFKESPENWPHLERFHRKLLDLLEYPLPVGETGNLVPVVLDLSPEAKRAWISFHDEIEEELRPGRDMAESRDVASKAADNAARLAGLLHVFDNGPGGQVGADNMEKAARIVTWHLYEARRFIGEIALPVQILNAMKLDEWLLRYCRENGISEIHVRDVQRNCPNSIRDKVTLQRAVTELIDAARIRITRDGKRKMIRVNPSLLEEKDGTP